jgi:hypothetical protein
MFMRSAYFFVFFLILAGTASARILPVPSAKYLNIQSAIDSSLGGDTVLVQPGIYAESINFSGKNIIVGSLYLTTGDTAYISETIIDGNFNAVNTGCVVLFVNGEDSGTQLSGFTITGGYYSGGGGIQCAFNSSPTLAHLVVTGNIAGTGGGIYCFGNSSPTITGVHITSNAALYSGGGIACEQFCAPRITNTVINNNAANSFGGGLYFNDSCFAEISETHVEQNTCSWAGAGIFCGDFSDIILKNSLILDNSCDDQGGGLYFMRSNPYLERVEIIGNTAAYGSGIFCALQADPLLMNLTISNNMATGTTGVDSAGGGIHIWNSHPAVVNSILWQDSKPEIFLEADPGDSSSLAIAYSDVHGDQDSILLTQNSRLYWLDHNFNSDPLFLYPLSGDYRLDLLSPCRDAGIQNDILVYNNNLDTLVIPALTYLDGAPDLGASETGISAISSNNTHLPAGFRLEQNYPNPFNATTTFRFSIPAASQVSVEIYNLLGQKVMILLDAYLSAGSHKVRAEINDLATGVYLYRIKTGALVQSRKMILLR